MRKSRFLERSYMRAEKEEDCKRKGGSPQRPRSSCPKSHRKVLGKHCQHSLQSLLRMMWSWKLGHISSGFDTLRTIVWKYSQIAGGEKRRNREKSLVLSLLDCLPSREAGEADWWYQFIAISQKELSEEMARPTENKGKSHVRPKIKENHMNKTSSSSPTRKLPFQMQLLVHLLKGSFWY